MAFRRALTVFAALAVSAAVATPTYAQNKDQQQQQKRKLTGDEQRHFESLYSLTNDVASGKTPAPADVKLKLQSHFLKSAQNVYVPYILEISGGKFTNFPVAMYVRAVKKGAAAAPAVAAAPAKEGEAPKPPDFAFADVYFLTEKSIVPGPTPDTTQVPRALELPSGDYDLFIALSERQPKDKKLGPAKSVVMTQPLAVPDLSKGLMTSNVILAKSLDPAPEQLTGQQQLEQPFTISGYRVTPTFESSFPKSGELLFVFFVYNEGVAASGKPEVDVDYNFYRASEEKPFSKLATQSFNATTLPAEFNLNAGHQVFVGQGIPLTSFNPGDYKLEIKITDKISSQSVTRNVPFTVAP
jgi:hypothetical protein